MLSENSQLLECRFRSFARPAMASSIPVVSRSLSRTLTRRKYVPMETTGTAASFSPAVERRNRFSRYKRKLQNSHARRRQRNLAVNANADNVSRMSEPIDIRLIEGRQRAEDIRRPAAGEVTPEELRREDFFIRSAWLFQNRSPWGPASHHAASP